MFKSNKKNILDFEPLKNTPLLSSRSKGVKKKLKNKNIKDRVKIKKIEDINGMQITYGIIKKRY